MDILSTKEIIKHATLGIPKGMTKYYSFVSTIDILIRNENIKPVSNNLACRVSYKPSKLVG